MKLDLKTIIRLMLQVVMLAEVKVKKKKKVKTGMKWRERLPEKTNVWVLRSSSLVLLINI